MTEKRVQLSTIVKSQVPDYVRTDFPLISEFLKDKGFIDFVVDRKNLKNSISKVMNVLA